MTLSWSDATHQVQDAGRLSLIFHTLAEEKKAFTSLAGVGNITVSNVLLLSTEIAGQMVRLDRIVSEPEEFFGEAQAPTMVDIG